MANNNLPNTRTRLSYSFVVASHLAGVKRVKMFRKQLFSMETQSLPPQHIFLSISTDDKFFFNLLHLQSFKKVTLVTYEEKSCLSQYTLTTQPFKTFYTQTMTTFVIHN